MKTTGTGRFTAHMCRFFAIASIAMVASLSAYANLEGDAAYNGRFAIQSFVPDVKALIVEAATRHSWKVIDEKPGEVTFELIHLKTHMAVIAKAFYTKSEFWFEKVSAKTYQCVPELPCQVDPAIVQRWMVTLRREAGV